MKTLFLIPALVVSLAPLGASNLGWPDIFGPNNSFNTPPSGGVFGGAQPKDAPAPTDPDPAPATPAPLPSLSMTGSGLLEFVFQQAYAGVESGEAERIRAVLAPQYAILAQYLQGAFNGATQVEMPPDVLGTPTPDPAATTPDPGVSVTQAMAVVAVTALLNDMPSPGAITAAAPAGTSTPDVTDPVAAATSSSFPILLLVDTQGFNLDSNVPEPSTALLLASAGLAMAWASKRRT